MPQRRESDCIFCKIVAGEIPATMEHRDEHVVAVADLNPQAPVHLLVLPVEHYADVGAIAAEGRDDVAAALLRAAAMLGLRHGGDGGFRLVVNTGTHGGQTVGHAHVHVLAGRPMRWPPG